MSNRLSETERKEKLAPLFDMGWRMAEGRDALVKTYTFANFIEAFGWMTKAAFWAEKLNHHPEWTNVYKTVQVVLTTHDANGLSSLDVKLAQTMDRLFAG